jgi:hypothetical protein
MTLMYVVFQCYLRVRGRQSIKTLFSHWEVRAILSKLRIKLYANALCMHVTTLHI